MPNSRHLKYKNVALVQRSVTKDHNLSFNQGNIEMKVRLNRNTSHDVLGNVKKPEYIQSL